MMNNFGAGFLLTAENKAGPIMQEFGQQIGGLKEQMIGVGMAAKEMGERMKRFADGVKASIGQAIDADSEFSKAAKMAFNVADQTKMPLDQIRKASDDLAMTFGSKASDQAAGFAQAFKLGFTDVASATDVMTASNKLAIVQGASLGETIDGVTMTMKAYASRAYTATQVADMFAVASKHGGGAAQDLSFYLGQVIPTADNLNIGLQEVLGAITTVTSQGIPLRRAIGGVNTVFSGIANASKDATAEAARLGISFDVTTLRAQGLTKFMQSIVSSPAFNGDTMNKLFGSAGSRAALALTSDGMRLLTTNVEGITKAGGATDKMFDVMNNSLGQTQKRIEAVHESNLITFGEAAKSVLLPFVQLSERINKAFNELLTSLSPEARQGFMTFVGGFATLVGMVGGIIALVGVMNLFGITLRGVLISAASFVGILVPLTLLVTGFGVAAYATFRGFQKNTAGVGDTWAETMRKLKLGWQATIEMISSGELSQATKDELGKTENQGVRGFVDQIGLLFTRLK